MTNKLYSPILIESVKAVADLSQYRFVGFDGNYCAAGAKALGVVDVSTEKGQYAPSAVFGTLLVEVGDTISAGDPVASDAGQEGVDCVVAEEAILYSSTLIDGYLRGRYSLPLNTHFPLLRILAIDLSIYRLYSRRMRNEMPEVIDNNYKNAIATLRDIQKGTITLEAVNDSSTASTFQSCEYQNNKTLLDKLFSKDRMSEY